MQRPVACVPPAGRVRAPSGSRACGRRSHRRSDRLPGNHAGGARRVRAPAGRVRALIAVAAKPVVHVHRPVPSAHRPPNGPLRAASVTLSHPDVAPTGQTVRPPDDRTVRCNCRSTGGELPPGSGARTAVRSGDRHPASTRSSPRRSAWGGMGSPVIRGARAHRPVGPAHPPPRRNTALRGAGDRTDRGTALGGAIARVGRDRRAVPPGSVLTRDSGLGTATGGVRRPAERARHG